ncbi:hypothetical protein J3E69DRAFT_337581 [Trichoderma sp. SZMC 28015]
MSLAIRLMRFKYLHLLVLTLSDDAQYATLRLESSREALSLLPYLSRRSFIILLPHFSWSSTISRLIQRHQPRAKI